MPVPDSRDEEGLNRKGFDVEPGLRMPIVYLFG